MQMHKFRNSLWFAITLVAFYLGAIVLANYLITKYGQVAVPFVAFALIPFDLIARDLMQDHWNWVPGRSRMYVAERMSVVIVVGAVISYATGTGSFRINAASCLAFMAAATIDALTYQWMIRYGRIFRINAATFTAAVTDSLIFVFIAFSAINWQLVGLQIVMKISGGFVWSLLLYKLFRQRYDRVEFVPPMIFKKEYKPTFDYARLFAKERVIQGSFVGPVNCGLCSGSSNTGCRCHSAEGLGCDMLCHVDYIGRLVRR